MSASTRLYRRALAAITLTTPLAMVITPPEAHSAPDAVAGGPVIVFNDNGAWSWFEDERAVVDTRSGTLLVSSVADDSGTDGAARAGNVEVVAYDVTEGTLARTVLHAGLQADDHDSAALHVDADGDVVAMYAGHHMDDLTRWRVARPDGEWGPERTLAHPAPVTYANVLPARLRGRDVLVAFVRAAGWDPNILVSRDGGERWHHLGRLLAGPGRPYVRYAADGAGRVHVLTTPQHPDDHANGIHHGVVEGGRLLRSDGTVADAVLTDDDAVAPEQLTEVFAGGALGRAWTIDLHVDQRGRPYAAFSVRDATGHHYAYARHDGSRWHVHHLAHAGRALYPGQPHYTGLVALDPQDPSRVVVSTDAHPASGAPLVSAADGRRHHELFEGLTRDGGRHWSWRAITVDSTDDNLRPIIPIWDSRHRAILWLRGRYTTYLDYDLDVVGIIEAFRPVHVDVPAGGAPGCGSTLAAWQRTSYGTPTPGSRSRPCTGPRTSPGGTPPPSWAHQASRRTRAACTHPCTGGACGRCASTPGSVRRRRPTSGSSSC